MSDRMQVTLDVDDSKAQAGVKRANAGLSTIEKVAASVAGSATKSLDGMAASIVRNADKTAQASIRSIEAIERRAALAGKNTIERLKVEEAALKAKLGGDERAIQRVVTAYGRLREAAIKAQQERNKVNLPGVGDFLTDPINSARAGIYSLGQALGTVGVVAVGVGAALAAASVGAVKLAKDSGELAEQQGLVARRTGLTVTEVGLFDRAAKEAGLSGVDILERSMKTLSETLAGAGEEGKKGRKALVDLGVQAFDPLTGKARATAPLFLDIADALGKVGDGAEAAVKAKDLFGSKLGIEALPLFNAGLRSTISELERAGVAFTESGAKKAQAFDDSLDVLERRWISLKKKIADATISAIEFFRIQPGSAQAQATQEFPTPGLSEAFSPAEIAARSAQRAAGRQGTGILQNFLSGAGNLQGSQDRLKDLKENYEKARAEAQRLAEIGGVMPELARKQVAEVERTRIAYERQNDAVKSLEKLEAKRLENLERIRELARQGDSVVVIGSGGLQSVVSGQQISDTNGAQEGLARIVNQQTGEVVGRKGRAPSLFSKGEAGFSSTARLGGLQLDSGTFLNVGEGARLEQLAASGAGDEEKRVRLLREAVDFGRQELDFQTRRTELLAGSGQNSELRAIERITELRLKNIERERALGVDEKSLNLEIVRIQEDREIKQLEVVRRQFDRIKDEAGSLFDTLISHTSNFGQALAAVLKTALLTPVKEAVSNTIAGVLTGRGGVVGGGGGGGTVSLGGGLLARLGLGGGGSFGLSGAPGGTVGFNGPVSLGGGGVSTTTLSGIGGTGIGSSAVGGVGLLGGLRGNLARLGNLGGGFSTAHGGVNGAAGGALLAGGGTLLFDGLRRGGVLGTLEAGAGGALIGAKFGGPLGAAIGAGVGLAAGLIRSMFKSATEKVREKIKATYGVDISARNILEQITGIAKSAFGGNLDVAIFSPQIRDLVELYALSTGQRSTPPGVARPSTFVQSGGSLVQVPNYYNGSALPAVASNAGPQQIVVRLDGEASAAFLQGQTVRAVADNPRAVAAAQNRANRGSFLRRENFAASIGQPVLTS